jgi:transposase
MASLMRHDYDAGASIREIADAFERSYGFTRTLLEETGGLRKRGGSKQVTS